MMQQQRSTTCPRPQMHTIRKAFGKVHFNRMVTSKEEIKGNQRKWKEIKGKHRESTQTKGI
jgi:hypothetical protein